LLTHKGRKRRYQFHFPIELVTSNCAIPITNNMPTNKTNKRQEKWSPYYSKVIMKVQKFALAFDNILNLLQAGDLGRGNVVVAQYNVIDSIWSVLGIGPYAGVATSIEIHSIPNK
jgi:hypothetical protein